jgi:chromosome segregation and condensation protein ScpB
MRHVTIALPDELSAALAGPGQDLTRAAFEALALAAYRERKISAAQLRELLGYQTRMEVDAFLKSHGVELEYTAETLSGIARRTDNSACRCNRSLLTQLP